MRYPCPYDYPDNCNCTTCTNDRRGVVPGSRTRRSSDRRQRRGSNLGSSESLSGGDKFEGRPIKIITGARGRKERFEFFYGGLMTPDGIGHGHVVCNDGETINYWREPSHEGGRVVIDDNWSSERLASHMF